MAGPSGFHCLRAPSPIVRAMRTRLDPPPSLPAAPPPPPPPPPLLLETPAKRPRGRPRNCDRLLPPPGFLLSPSAPARPAHGQYQSGGLQPLVLKIDVGQDIISRIVQVSLISEKAVCVLSVLGSVQEAKLIHSSGAVLNHKGPLQIIRMFGSILTPSASGSRCLSATLACADCSVVGGIIAGPLIAVTTIKAIVGTFCNDAFRTKTAPKMIARYPNSQIVTGYGVACYPNPQLSNGNGIRHHPSSQVTIGTESTQYSGSQVDIANGSAHHADSQLAIGNGSTHRWNPQAAIGSGGTDYLNPQIPIGNGRTDYPNQQVTIGNGGTHDPNSQIIFGNVGTDHPSSLVNADFGSTRNPNSKVPIGNGNAHQPDSHITINDGSTNNECCLVTVDNGSTCNPKSQVNVANGEANIVNCATTVGYGSAHNHNPEPGVTAGDQSSTSIKHQGTGYC